MKKNNILKHKQLEVQQERWNSRANIWDTEISASDHYVNFEDGYSEFLKLEKEILNKYKTLKTGVDIGCGSGVTSELLAKHVEKLYLVDIAEKMLEVALMKVPSAISLHASATAIPIDNESINIAISRGVVVSHLPRDIYLNFFRELERIVVSGGIILFDYISNINSVHFSIQSPKITFSRDEMEIILTGHGFTEIIFHGSGTSRVVRVSARKI